MSSVQGGEMISVELEADVAEGVVKAMLQEDLASILRDYNEGVVMFDHDPAIEARKTKKLINAYRRVLGYYGVEL